MAIGFAIRKNQYYDSVFLMRVAKTLSEEPGVRQSAVLMATDENKKLLAGIGFATPELASATPNDLFIGLEAEDAELINRYLDEMDGRLRNIPRPDIAATYRTVEDATTAHPQSNLVVVSTPGAYAGREARKALERGKHVFLFSDNVPIEEEIELKQLAKTQRRLVMGPDCGTSLIGGVRIGFAKHVRRGPVGAVGASGTGLQEFTSLIHQAGSGISQAIGTGSHDLVDAVGGVTTQMGLEMLEADPATRVIALISKPSGAQTLERLQGWIRNCRKPVIGCLLGLERTLEGGDHYYQAESIDQAVRLTLQQLGVSEAGAYQSGSAYNSGGAFLDQTAFDMRKLEGEIRSWLPEQRYLRGLFAGGTFCFQAQQVLKSAGIPAFSNNPLDPRYRLKNPEESLEHSLLDLGDDYFTQGKPHPMIDSRERRRRILKEADDPEVAIVLLDFVLGEIASADPVGDLLPAIVEAREKVAHRGGRLSVAASVCGTDQDPQDLNRQNAKLTEAGVFVLPSSARAAELCRDLLQAAGGR